MQRHGHRDIHHVYVYQFIFILHDHDQRVRFDVPNVRGIWFEGYRSDGECPVQYWSFVLHLRRSALCFTTRAHEFPKETAHGWIELDEFRCTNRNQHVPQSHRNEPIQHQLRRLLRRQPQSIQIGKWMSKLITVNLFISHSIHLMEHTEIYKYSVVFLTYEYICLMWIFWRIFRICFVFLGGNLLKKCKTAKTADFIKFFIKTYGCVCANVYHIQSLHQLSWMYQSWVCHLMECVNWTKHNGALACRYSIRHNSKRSIDFYKIKLPACRKFRLENVFEKGIQIGIEIHQNICWFCVELMKSVLFLCSCLQQWWPIWLCCSSSRLAYPMMVWY